MTTFAFPSSEVVPNAQRVISLANSGALNPSPFTGYVQTFGRSGSKLGLLLNFRDLKYDQAQLLQGFFLHLHGQEHRFSIRDHHYTQVGSMAGTPLVNGADQSGYTLITDGWDPGNEIKAGNRVSYVNGNGHSEIKIVTTDVTADSGGNATLSVFPDIHTAPANNAAIQVTAANVLGTWKLAPGAIEFSGEPGDWTNFNVNAIEDAP